MVDGLNGLGTTGQPNASKNALAKKSLTDNYEMFLKLLTEQLKNQDPLQPQDASEFTNQLVQFSQVEQQIASNEKLETLITKINQGRPAQALNYLGMMVEMEGAGLSLQDSQASFTVTLPKPARETKVEILDSADRLVRTLSMPTRAGIHDLTWDGKSDTGQQLKDGFYKVRVTAKGQDGEAFETLTHTRGVVTGIDMADGDTYLAVGAMHVKMEDVQAVRPRPRA